MEGIREGAKKRYIDFALAQVSEVLSVYLDPIQFGYT